MTLPLVDIRVIGATLRQAAREAVDAHATGEFPPPEHEAPQDLLITVTRFLEIAEQLDDQTRSSGTLSVEEMTRFGEHGLTLAVTIADWSRTLDLDECRARVNFTLPALSVWVARHGGELTLLEPVVNALAEIANGTYDGEELAGLCGLMGEIIEAAAPAIKQDLDKVNSGRPWRVLIVNRGIVATRSHKIRHMERAFEDLIQYLPEEAPAFFEEGMRQMDALDYPSEVRQVVKRYHKEWSARTLH